MTAHPKTIHPVDPTAVRIWPILPGGTSGCWCAATRARKPNRLVTGIATGVVSLVAETARCRARGSVDSRNLARFSVLIPFWALSGFLRVAVTRPYASRQRATRVSPDALPAYEFIADWRILYRGRSLVCRIDPSGRCPGGMPGKSRNGFRAGGCRAGVTFNSEGDVCVVSDCRCPCCAHWQSYGCCRLRLLQK